MNRPPSPPPDLPGYSYVRNIGGGGFADVFLYDQQVLGRKVAVKVLLSSESSPAVRAQFNAESTLMAALSTHPHIVSIYDAAIAADGRPYLVMEYCSRQNLSERYKSEAIPVADVAAIGIQLAGAIETAHRAGILHRDIKPANVLTTDYHRPALTDFGISVAAGAAADGDTVGMTIPWSPPEMLSDQPDGDQRADVYSLAATLYTLLARRSPYERSGGPNSAVDLVNRIQRSPLPPIGRSDVPESLERAIARGLAKNPAHRWSSALQFARALQDAQAEQRWPVTQIDVIAEDPGAAQAELAPEDDGRTRVRGLTTIHAQGPAQNTVQRDAAQHTMLRSPTRPATPTFGASHEHAPYENTQMRGTAADAGHLAGDRLAAPLPADTVLRSRPGAAEPATEGMPAAKRKWPLYASLGAVAVIAGVVALALTNGGSAPAPLPSDDTESAQSVADVELGVPEPANLAGQQQDGALLFTWTNPDPQSGDSFQWQRTDVAAPQAQIVTGTEISVDAEAACIEVILVRENGRFSQPARACAKAG